MDAARSHTARPTKATPNASRCHSRVGAFDPARAASGEILAIADVLEILSIPLLGIVPESKDVLRASNIGSPITICAAQSAAARAYTEAARRLSGESVAMTIPNNKKGLLDRLFGRRAA